mgnify:CR=1 FL=1
MIYATKKGKLAYRLHQKFHNDMISQTISGVSKEEEEVLISSLERLNLFFKEKYELKD